MIHIKLGERREVGDEPMHRDWVGYDPTETDETSFERNRGLWVFGARAKRERYAAFSSTLDHKIKYVAEIDGIQRYGAKCAIVGRVLGSDHPLARLLVGAHALDPHRNPVTYHPDPGRAPTCACGCGENVAIGRDFASGHDQVAIHARIGSQWGSTLGFVEWFDATYPDWRDAAEGMGD